METWLGAFTWANKHKSIINMTGQKTYDLFIEWCRETKPTFDTNPLKLGIKITNLKIDAITKGPQVCFVKLKNLIFHSLRNVSILNNYHLPPYHLF